jgi:hypothetical protein
LFCTKHSLSPSIKAGGYGTAGWAIGGDIIVDLSKLVEVDIEPPHADGSFTSLKEVAPANSKGKKAVPSAVTSSGKRRREDDAELRRYDMASQAVATFLRGPPLSAIPSDDPPPNVRRRIDPEASSSSSSTNLAVRQVSIESDSNSASSTSEASSAISRSLSNYSESTVATTPSPPSGPMGSSRPSSSVSFRSADPFGYLNDSNNKFSLAPPPNTMQSAFAPQSMHRSWGGMSSLYGSQGQAQAEPIYPHAFVTFGAGMRQKEIDTYTAQHKLEARYSTGGGDGIPYHVPL